MKKTQRILQLLDRIDELEKQLKEEREKNDHVPVNFTPLPSEPNIVEHFDFIEWLQTKGFKEEALGKFTKGLFILRIDVNAWKFDVVKNHETGLGFDFIRLSPTDIPNTEEDSIALLSDWWGIELE